MNNKLYKTLLLSGLMILVVPAAWAQGSGPGNGGPTPTDIPIDGGIGLLAAGGAALGINKLRKRFKK